MFDHPLHLQGLSVLQVTALDGDRGIPNDIRYRFASGNLIDWKYMLAFLVQNVKYYIYRVLIASEFDKFQFINEW